MICVYHSTDFDGVCSAAISLNRWPGIKLVGVTHTDDQEAKYWEIIKSSTGFPDEVLYVIDYAFPPHLMVDLSKRFVMTWIDHHQTSIDTMRACEAFKPWSQITVVGTAGCELAWDEMFPDHDRPVVVDYLGRYDVWDHSNPDTVAFQFGLHSVDDSMNPNSSIWDPMLDIDFYDETMDETLRFGEAIVKYQRNQTEQTFKSTLFRTSIPTNSSPVQILAANCIGIDSGSFEPYMDSTTAAGCLFGMTNDGRWKVGLYGGKNCQVDLGAIAKTFPGGGGHKGSAGFTVNELPVWLTSGMVPYEW